MPDIELSALGSVIKTAYEGEADTNAFTDAEQTKLSGVATGATVGIATQDEGGSIDVDATTLNFVGAGVTATDAGGGITTVTVAGGGGSALEVENEGVSLSTAVTKINFAGSGIVATEPLADEILVTVNSVTSNFTGFRATANATQSITASTTTIITLGNEVFDTENGFASNVFTVPASLNGKYMDFTAGLYINITGGSFFNLWIQKDGATIADSTVENAGTLPGTSVSTGPILLTTGEVYRIVAFTETGSTTTVQNSTRTFFSGVIIEAGTNNQIQSEETASHVASEDDFAGNRVLKLNNAAAMTYTVNSGLTNKQPLSIIQTGAGQVTVVAGASVTINSAGGALLLSGQYSAATLIPDVDNADTYFLVGDITV